MLKDIAQEHCQWVSSMKWTPPTPLESLAMIFSELGEVAFELDKASFFEHNNLGDLLLHVRSCFFNTKNL